MSLLLAGEKKEKKRKRRSFGSARHFAAIFLAYEAVNGSLNSQMARTLGESHKPTASSEGFVCVKHLMRVQDVFGEG